jgi:hypothetical protein
MFVEQHVFGFDVPVRDALGVQVVHCFQDLPEHQFGFLLTEVGFGFVLHVLVEGVASAVLHDQVDLL